MDSPTCYTLPDFPQIIHVVAKSRLGVSLLKQISIEEENMNEDDSIFSHRFKLLGIKYHDVFSRDQANTLTPYEIDDAIYKNSLDFLTEIDQGWLIFVLAKINAYNDIMESILEVFSNTDHLPNDSKFTADQLMDMSVIVSPSPQASYKRIFSFFSESELSSGLDLSEKVSLFYSRGDCFMNQNITLN